MSDGQEGQTLRRLVILQIAGSFWIARSSRLKPLEKILKQHHLATVITNTIRQQSF